MLSEYRERLQTVIAGLDMAQIRAVGELLRDVQAAGSLVLVVGNGGGAATASHLASDLQKLTRVCGSRAIKALALTDSVALITAWANDTSFEMCLAAQLDVFVEDTAVLVCISAGGASPNVLAAARSAKTHGITVVGITSAATPLAQLSDHAVQIPSTDMQIIEDCQAVVCHMLSRFAAERGEGTC